MFGDKKKELLINQLNLCLTTGRRLAQLKRYNEAIYYFDQAMEAEADDGVNVLVARSKAYSALSNHTKAREDAELAMQRQPETPSVLENDAYTLYEMDRFEQALVEYHQGLRIRQKPDYFQNGVLVATETVEDCVGRHADDLFRYDHLGSTVLQIWLKQHLLLKPWIVDKDVNALKEQKRREQSERFFAQRYLGHLNNDKKFLLSCRNNTQLYCGEIDSYNALQNVLIDALAKVNRRQKTLMRLKPYYIHKLNESALKISPKLRQKQEDSKRKEELAAAQIVFQKLHAAREAQRNHDTVLCLRVSERAREYVKNQPLRLLRSKSVYINSIYNIIGDLYLGMKEFIPGWTQEENDFRILYMLGVDVVNECAEEHLRRTFLPYIYDPRKLLEDSEKEMAQTSTHLERAFLYHEMSRSCGQLGRHELARTMGRRCAQEARPAKSPVWTINGMFMVARFESLQRNYVDAKNTLNESIEVAKKLNNQDWSNFLMRALQLLEFSATVSVDRNIILAKRQKDMLESMPNRSMKMKMGLIFTNMNRQPPSRRMMLVPGVMPSQTKKSKKSKRKPRQSETVNRGNVRDRRRNEHPDFIRTLEFRIRPKAVRSFQ